MRNCVIVITGPCGAGKTTISTLVAEKFSIPCLRGDDIKEELFPGLVNITKYPKELKAVKAKLLRRAEEVFRNNSSVVVDYIVIGRYIQEFQKLFGNHLIFKVLFPVMEILVHRDENRDCWTAGEDHLHDLCSKFKRDEALIGNNNFIDNSHESAIETLEKHFAPLL